MKIDLIVLTYKPDQSFIDMVLSISGQSTRINSIIIFNTEQKFFDRLTYSAKFSSEYKNSQIHHISRREFDNGRIRNMAVKCSDADYFVMLAQNAVPDSPDFICEMVQALEQAPDIAAAYGRLRTPQDAPETEKYLQRYFYPEDSYIRSKADYEHYGWLTAFMTNNCAIYRRDVFEKLGGFVDHAIANEDILYAAKAIDEGYRIAYVPTASVEMRGSLDFEDIKKKFFDYYVSYSKHPEVFSLSEMKDFYKKLMRLTKNHVYKSGRASEKAYFSKASRNACKGAKLGKRYKSLSMDRIRELTATPGYWSNDELMRDRSGVNSRLGYGRSTAEMEMLKKPPVVRHVWDEPGKDTDQK